MKSTPHSDPPDSQHPRHIAEILPEVLARYGLVPADVWAAPTAGNISPVVPVELVFSGVSVPLSLS
jgi:hypothetical protein